MSRKAYLIREMAKAQGRLCAYCGQTMTFRPRCPNTATIDHMVPLGRGGPDRRSNMLAACYDCNHRKGEMTLAEFAAVYGVRIGDAA